MVEPLPVTLVANAGAYGGIATHLNQLYAQLQRLCAVRHVLLFTVNHTALAPADIKPHVWPTTHAAIGSSRLLRPFLLPINLLREYWIALSHRDCLRQHTVFVSHDPNAFWGLVHASRTADYFLFVTPILPTHPLKRTLIGLWRRWLHRLVARRLTQKRLRLIAPTAFAAEGWADYLHISPQAIHLLPNPPFLAHPCQALIADTQPAHPAVADILAMKERGQRIVLSVGHMEYYKNPQRWLEIARAMQGAFPTLSFVWLGDGPMLESIRSQAAGSPNILLPGRMNQADVRRVYQASWAFFHPATIESQGLVVMDALTFGMPVIVNRSDALPGLIAGTEAGFVLDCDQASAPQELTTIVERLHDAAAYMRVSKAALALAEERYSYNRWKAALTSLFTTEALHA